MAKVKETKCPVCSHEFDSASGVSKPEAIPKPGDLSICIECTAFLRYDDAMDMRLLTAEEIVDLDASVRGELVRARKEIKEMRLEFGQQGEPPHGAQPISSRN